MKSQILKRIFRKLLILFRILKLEIGYWLLGIEFINEALLCYSFGVKEILNYFGASVQNDCIIHGPLVIHNADKDYSNLIIKNRVHIGRNVTFDLSQQIKLEQEVVVSLNSILLTHQDVGERQQKSNIPSTQEPLIIGENSYLGSGVIVLAGCNIGSSVIVGAGSVVNKPLPDNVTALGTPARILQ